MVGLCSLEKALPLRVVTKARTAGALLLTGLWFKGQGTGGRMFCKEGPAPGAPATSGLTQSLPFNFKAFSTVSMFKFIF